MSVGRYRLDNCPLGVILQSTQPEELWHLLDLVRDNHHHDSSGLPHDTIMPGMARPGEAASIPYGTGGSHSDTTAHAMELHTHKVMVLLKQEKTPLEVVRLALLLALSNLEGFRKFVHQHTAPEHKVATRFVLTALPKLTHCVCVGAVLYRDSLLPIPSGQGTPFYQRPIELVAHARELFILL